MAIAAFDFDGTLTTKDSFIEFIKFVKGKKNFWFGFLLLSPVLILYKIGVVPNYKAKEIVFSFFFKGMRTEDFTVCCHKFANCIDQMLNPDMMTALCSHKTKSDTVLIISASIEDWLIPWASNKGVDLVLGTKIKISGNCLTGRFLTKNCYGQEKVDRLLKVFPQRETYKLYAYGDSRGDKELLDFADFKIKI